MRILVSAKNQAHSFDCERGEKILYAGLRHGIELPYECGTGTCGTCKAKLIHGDIHNEWPEAPGQSYLKREIGEFLMCQSVARTDCSLEVGNIVKTTPPSASGPLTLGAVLRRLTLLTHEVVSLDLELDQRLDFEAGEFMVMRVPGIPGWRAYSMVNFDRQTKRLVFVVKKKPGGGVSEWLFGNDVEGARVELFGPLGHATFHPDIAKNVVLIGGGSGIAGMMSILSRGCQEGYFERYEGHLFFGIRTARDAFFLEQLTTLKSEYPRTLHLTVAVSDEDVDPALETAHPLLTFDTGLVHAVASRRMKGRFQSVRAYAAGPAPMVEATLRMLLLEGKLTSDDIRYDKFT